MQEENRKIGQPRLVGLVSRGWHVRIHGIWRLVDSCINDRGTWHVLLVGDWLPRTYVAGCQLESRSPAEQIQAVTQEEQVRRMRLLAEHDALAAPC